MIKKETVLYLSRRLAWHDRQSINQVPTTMYVHLGFSVFNNGSHIEAAKHG